MKITFNLSAFLLLAMHGCITFVKFVPVLMNKRWTFRLKTGEWQPFKWWASAKSNMAGCEGLVGHPCTYRFVIKKTHTRTDDWSIVPAKEPQLLLETGTFSEKSHAGPTLQKLEFEVWTSQVKNLEFLHVIRNQTANLSRSSHATGQHAGRRHSWAVATDIWPGLNGLGGLCLQWNTPCCNHQHRMETIPAVHRNQKRGCFFVEKPSKGTYVLRCFLRLHHSGIFFFEKSINGFLWSSFGCV